MVTWLEVALLIEGVVFFALAGFALRKGPRHASMRMVALFAAFWGYAAWMFAFPSILDWDVRTGSWLFGTGVATWNSILLALAIVYPTTRLTGWRKAAAIATIGIPIAYAIGFYAFGDVFFDADGNLSANGAAWVFGIHAVPLATPMVVFGVRWWRSGSETIRLQMAYATAGFIITNLNDALTQLPGFNIALGAAVVPLGGVSGFVTYLNVLRVAVIVAFAGLAAYRLVRSRFADRGALFVAGMFVLGAGLSTLQRLDGEVHILVDGLAFFLAFYGLTRSLALDFDLRLSTPAARTVLFGIGITLLFIVQQTIEQFVGDTLSVAAGAIVAGTSLVLLAPLGGLLHRLRVGGPALHADAYENYRRFQIYRTALEGALKDARIDPLESEILANLRRGLLISEADHDRLVAELGAPTATRSPIA